MTLTMSLRRFVSDLSLRKRFGKDIINLVKPLLFPITRIWSHTIKVIIKKRGGVYVLDDVEKVVASLQAIGQDSHKWTKYAEERERFVRVEMPERRSHKIPYVVFMMQQRLLDPKGWMNAKAIDSQ
jgi:hypothetical protein